MALQHCAQHVQEGSSFLEHQYVRPVSSFLSPEQPEFAFAIWASSGQALFLPLRTTVEVVRHLLIPEWHAMVLGWSYREERNRS